MEVHHHSHTPPANSGTGRKKWTHYIWEFLMLFLAVFCGFLAENQREHYIEKIRARQYARTLVSDLKKDTLMMNKVIDQMTGINRFTDSLIQFLDGKTIDQIRNIDLFLYTYSDANYQPYAWNRATLEQIKSSGSLRYFSNDSIVRAITAYDAFTRHMDEDHAGDEERASRIDEKRNQIVDLNYPHEIHSALNRNRDSLFKTDFLDAMEAKGLRLLTSDINDIKKYINEKITLQKFMESRGTWELPRVKYLANKLIHLLKEEYHL